jgi:hypothetical protein
VYLAGQERSAELCTHLTVLDFKSPDREIGVVKRLFGAVRSCLSGFRSAVAGTLIALLPLPEGLGIDSSRGYFAETVCPWTDLP